MKQRRAAQYQAAARQAGAYAVEFALTFTVFFVVCYAIVTYAFIFTAQQMLNVAADDAARIALRWHEGSSISTEQMNEIRNVVNTRTAWLTAVRGQALEIAVCSGNGTNIPGSGSTTQTATLCASHFIAAGDTTARHVGVLVRYPYREEPLVPLLGPGFLMGLVVPEWLSAFSAITPYRSALAVPLVAEQA